MANPSFKLNSDISLKDTDPKTVVKNLVAINKRLEQLNKELEKKANDKKFEKRALEFLLLRELCLRELVFIFSLLAKKEIAKILREYKERGSLNRLEMDKEGEEVQEVYREVSKVADTLSDTIRRTKALLENTLRPALKNANERVSTSVTNTANRLEPILTRQLNPMDPRPNAPFSMRLNFTNSILNHLSALLIHHPQLLPVLQVADKHIQTQEPGQATAAIKEKSQQQLQAHKEQYHQVIFDELMATESYSKEEAKEHTPLILKEIATVIPEYLLLVHLTNRVEQAEQSLAQAHESTKELTRTLPAPKPEMGGSEPEEEDEPGFHR